MVYVLIYTLIYTFDMWQFNNYVTLKLSFDPPTPPPSRIVKFAHESPLALRHAQHKSPLPSQ